MTDTLPGPLCGQMVGGSFVSYPCWLEQFHEGPCEAQEVPVSVTRRKRWLEQQGRQRETAQETTPAPMRPAVGIPAPPPALDPSALVDPALRERQAIDALAVPFVDLPSWAQQAIIANSSQVSLALLWAMATEHFNQGHATVTISREFLERLVTPSARKFFSTFIFKE